MLVRTSLLVLAASFAAGCAQPTSPTGAGSLPLSQSNAVTQIGPGASYNATGPWRHVVHDKQGNVFDGPVVTDLTQAADGTITWCGECEGELWTITPRGGQGKFISYDLSLTVPGSCVDVSGTARLDTSKDTITGRLTGGIADEETCSRAHDLLILTLTRNP